MQLYIAVRPGNMMIGISFGRCPRLRKGSVRSKWFVTLIILCLHSLIDKFKRLYLSILPAFEKILVMIVQTLSTRSLIDWWRRSSSESTEVLFLIDRHHIPSKILLIIRPFIVHWKTSFISPLLNDPFVPMFHLTATYFAVACISCHAVDDGLLSADSFMCKCYLLH